MPTTTRAVIGCDFRPFPVPSIWLQIPVRVSSVTLPSQNTEFSDYVSIGNLEVEIFPKATVDC